jgi:hypothetical protein
MGVYERRTRDFTVTGAAIALKTVAVREPGSELSEQRTGQV